MANSIMFIQRFDTSKFDWKDLDYKITNWVKKQSGRIRRCRKHVSRKKATYLLFEVKNPGWISLSVKALAVGSEWNLGFIYEAHVLYVVYNETLPEIYKNFSEAVVDPYVNQFGGRRIDLKPVIFDYAKLSIGDKGKLFLFANTTGSFKFIKNYLARENPITDLISQQQTPSDININFDSDIEKVQSSSEEVSVPPGVTIKVKRSRTIEHTLDINWAASGSVSIDVGIQKIVSASIKGGIERKQGKSFKASEEFGYEVELNGNQHSHYKLIWIDNWRKGYVELPIGSETQIIPFKLKEWAELSVQPLKN